MSEVQDLRQAADDAEAEAERQGREAERLTAERRQALVGGDDAALERAEAALIVAGRERERALLRAEGLWEHIERARLAAYAEEQAANRREVEELCRERLELAAEIDRLAAELAPVADKWRQLGFQLHAKWLTKGLLEQFGRIRADLQADDNVCLRACFPTRLMVELGGRPGLGTPLVETDPAKVALSKLDAAATIHATGRTVAAA